MIKRQTALFAGIPEIRKNVKNRNKEIINKTKNPKRNNATVTVNNRGKNTLANLLAVAIETAKKYLVDDGSYELITTKEQLDSYVSLINSKGFMSLDTETTGLNPISDKLVGVCLHTFDEKGVYIPVGHTTLDDVLLPGQLTFTEVAECLAKVDPYVNITYHNATFDIRFCLQHLGIRFGCFWDSALAGNYLNENEPHQLKTLWNKYCNKGDQEALKFNELFEGIPFNYIPLDIAKVYGGGDGIKTTDIYLFQKDFLDPDHVKCQKAGLVEAAKFFHSVEIPLVQVLVDMEQEGIDIDAVYAEQLSVKYQSLLTEAELGVYSYLDTLDYSLAGEKKAKLSNPINLNSPVQLAIIFYDILGLVSCNDKKPRGTGEDILSYFLENAVDKEQKKFFEGIMETRTLAKLLSTYINKLPLIVKPETGRLHGKFNAYGAATGRFSSSDPNLQNIPSKNKEIRKMFIAPEGFLFVGGDFSQQEPRVLAFVSGDEALVQAYRDNKDLYAWMAGAIYLVPYEECLEFRQDGTRNPEGLKRRTAMKEIVLGLMYGRGIKSIADKLGISFQQAKDVVEKFFSTFPKIKECIDYYQDMAYTEGYVPTVYGRKRRLPAISLPEYEFTYFKGSEEVPEEICTYYSNRLKAAYFKEKAIIKLEAKSQYGIRVIDNGAKIADAQRQVLNSIIQGTSADITKKAMLAIGTDTVLKDLGFKLLLTVHDEVIGKCPKENALACAERMSMLMIQAPADKITVPMKVDTDIVQRWYGEDLKKELQVA